MQISDKAKQIFSDIKALFNPAAPAAPAVPAVPVAASGPVSYTTKEGVEISVTQAGDKVAPGDMVTVSGAPAPAGDHTLEDGTVLSVDAGGVVTAVVEPAAPAEPAEPAAPVDMAAINSRLEALERELASMRQPLTQMEAVEKKVDAVFQLQSEMIVAPAAEPVTVADAKKEKFKKAAEAQQDKWQKMGEAIKEVKKY